MRRDRLGGLPHAGQVDPDHLVPLLVGQLPERRLGPDPGVGDEDVDLPELAIPRATAWSSCCWTRTSALIARRASVVGLDQLDRRALAIKADVRSQQQLDQAVERGIAEFGKIDIPSSPTPGVSTVLGAHRRSVGGNDAGQPNQRYRRSRRTRRCGSIVITSSTIALHYYIK